MMTRVIRTGRLRRCILGGTGLGICLQVGCALNGPDFLDAALPAIQSGVTTIVDGVLEGIFAVIQPEAGSTADR